MDRFAVWVFFPFSIFISLTFARQAYGHSDTFLWMKPAVATQATLSDKQQWVFYVQVPTGRTAHTTAVDGPVMGHWLEWKMTQTANSSTVQDQ